MRDAFLWEWRRGEMNDIRGLGLLDGVDGVVKLTNNDVYRTNWEMNWVEMIRFAGSIIFFVGGDKPPVMKLGKTSSAFTVAPID